MQMASNKCTTVLLAAALVALQAWWLAPAASGEAVDYAWAEVYITNNLEGQEVLQVHCKDADQDYGVHQLHYGDTYTFGLEPTPVSDYYCGFIFKNALHWFDIYLGDRDIPGCHHNCRWHVNEAGPCLVNPPACYRWNPDRAIAGVDHGARGPSEERLTK